MKSGKTKIIILLLAVLMAFPLAGCKKGNDDEKISVVCTVFPQYDWVRNIIGQVDGVEITLINDNGTDMHSYQATAQDIVKIVSSDLFIYVGGESDKWVDEVLENAANKDMRVVNLLSLLGERVKEEELADGMQDDDGHSHEEGESHEEEAEYDEHVWLSVKNAEFLCEKLTSELCATDEKNSEVYKSNSMAYIASLRELDREYAEAVEGGARKVLLFADRFPFRYLTDDYGLEYFAAFPGCSAETEASFQTIRFLADKINEYSLTYVLVLENSGKEVAQTVIKESKAENVQIAVMNSLQSVTQSDISAGETYISVMTSNLEVLKTVIK